MTLTMLYIIRGVDTLIVEAIAGFLLLVAITLDRGIQLRLAMADAEVLDRE